MNEDELPEKFRAKGQLEVVDTKSSKSTTSTTASSTTSTSTSGSSSLVNDIVVTSSNSDVLKLVNIYAF